ncbi:ribosomal protein S18 acetylase RimI-like enzyme [Sphingomonas naasensis]|uniref:GNAT family N-acetyltransferase n=1 Tax=Sphingomonas naasensis TaxID=1344951 RepID=A0A4S1WQL9_9SPHN|nr:GNAT family N-acetyltransferase [Sphingomonas naasensis]NIJ18379.1 ribosomal protein S18 acetylase RimI-like enzyme [Sphingomonas naasensis]TGX45648.1 GNAT family N-acetyltransferase [Sphingomonas naasensis]
MSDGLTIRVATLDDLPAIHPVIERAYRGETARAGWTHEADLIQGNRTDIATLAAIVDDPTQRLLVAFLADATIGCVQVSDKGDGLAYLGLLCIDPTLQAGGYGKQLVDAAETCAREGFGARRMEMTVIDVRRKLIAFYERRGYTVSGEKRDFPIPLDPPFFMDVLVKDL